MVRGMYEGFAVEHCPECRGCLVSRMSREGIERARERGEAELAAESAEFAGSTVGAVRCAQCLGMMTREVTDTPPIFEIDRCAQCGSVWLDPGELAMLQSAYEATPFARNTLDMQKRCLDLYSSPARLKRFRQNVERLPETTECVPGTPLNSALDGVKDAIRFAIGSLLARGWRGIL